MFFNSRHWQNHGVAGWRNKMFQTCLSILDIVVILDYIDWLYHVIEFLRLFFIYSYMFYPIHYIMFYRSTQFHTKTAFYHTISHNIIWYRIKSHDIMSCRMMSYQITRYHIIYHVLSNCIIHSITLYRKISSKSFRIIEYIKWLRECCTYCIQIQTTYLNTQ